MPRVNGNGKINVPAEIVTRMNGKPGDELIFIEELDPGDNTLKLSRTYKLSIMLRSVWDEEMKKAGEENGDKIIEDKEKASVENFGYEENSGNYLNQD